MRPKNPLEYFRKLRFHQKAASVRDYGLPAGKDARVTDGPHVIIHTDGACSGNPGPGGWGAILTFGEHEKELKGGEPHTTNNRMELMAAIAALEALKKPSHRRAAHRQQVCARRHLEMDPRLEAQRLEDRRQEAGEEHRPVAAARRRDRSSTTCAGTGSRATPAMS